jgi:hypothetical protein
MHGEGQDALNTLTPNPSPKAGTKPHLTQAFCIIILCNMKICGKMFDSKAIQLINTAIAGNPSISRTSLAEKVCQHFNWYTSSGEWQLGSCRKALAKLNKLDIITLPDLPKSYSFQTINKNKHIDFELPEIMTNLSSLGQITLKEIQSRRSKSGRLCSYLLKEYHYLGNGTFSGASIRYLIESEYYGPIGVLVFSSATFSLKERDKFIGWDENSRLHNLNRVICNNRFLILPSIHVANLASHILSLASKQVVLDWQNKYQVIPLAIETFIDVKQFPGTCYKAANWQRVGKSSGRRDNNCKDIYIRLLSPDAITQLCKKPKTILCEKERPADSSQWVEEEFGTVRFHDERLIKRLYTIADDFYNRPQSNIAEACQSVAKSTAAYRFLSNSKVSMDVLLTPHLEMTIERIKKHPVVLVPQDTTTLDYSTHPSTIDLGPTSHISDKSIGLMLHDSVAFTPQGTPLGVVDAQCWARDPDDKGKSKRRSQEPIENKESAKWLRAFDKVSEIQSFCPETMLISVGDRESDLYDLFVKATQDPNGAKILVRSERTRNRKLLQSEEYLWDFMAEQEIPGFLDIHLPKRGNSKARDAHVSVRYSEVLVRPPQRSKHDAIKINAVYIVENTTSENENPIEWLLLTTAPINNFDDAVRCVEWYAARWGIEIFHRTLKSGCRIKDRQLGSANTIQTCLAIDMIVAWRIYHLTMLGRETPDVPCTVFFEDVEWKALHCYYTKSKELPEKPPTLNQAILLLGAIGGHMGRKSDGPPGTQVIWRGLQRLDTAVEMYCLFTNELLPKCRKEYPKAYFPPGHSP